MINLVLVDDHRIVRDGITHLLHDFSDLKVIASLATGEAAIQFAKKNKVDVMLMDLNMPGIGGIEATRNIYKQHPETKILILTQHTEAPFPSQLLKMGSMGMLSKECHPDEIVKAIRTVHAGKRYVTPKIAEYLALQNLLKQSDLPLEQLSGREFQVMMKIVQGEKVKTIAEQFKRSIKTIKTTRTRLFSKLGVESNLELTHLAIRLGLLKLIAVD